MQLLCTAKLPANLLERYLLPLTLYDAVKEIIVVRQEPLPANLPKLRNVSFPKGGHAAIDAARMLREAELVLRHERVAFTLGFNPVPWGSVGFAAGWLRGVPGCLSFIGLDFKRAMHPVAAPALRLLNRARLITVTGERMRRGLVERGVDPSKIRILPHAVDTARFHPSEQEPDFDVISAGHLIERKRMDVLIDAVADLKARGIEVRTGILGEGPLRPALEAQIKARGVEGLVTLLGFRHDVELMLRRARIFALVSSWEGVPFAMIEALCSGLVPIMTDVGTISDWIEHEKNGHIVPVGDSRALATSIERLLKDPSHYQSLRERALAARQSLSLEAGVAFWRDALGEGQ
jgi:glycosyltransferase involved in cell wall biosynthesis